MAYVFDAEPLDFQTRFMHVDRTPLASIPPPVQLDGGVNFRSEDDPALKVFEFSKTSRISNTWGNLDGWLRNLPSTMRAEQALLRVDELHPSVARVLKSQKWSCPLRRLSFWTQVSYGFSPLTPSPARSARIFGTDSSRNMLHGTRSHPTQKFASLFGRLADASTSNGFCFCVDAEDCSVPSGECSLIETMRSMYDQKFRTAQLLTGNDRVGA